MPLYDSNIVLSVKLTSASTTLNTETFSETITDDIYTLLHAKLSPVANNLEIDFETVVTELVSSPPEGYTPMSSLNPTEEDSSYTPLVRSEPSSSSYTPFRA